METQQQKQQTKPLTVVFCLPGKTFSSEFVNCWSELLASLLKRQVNVKISMGVNSMVHFARAKCLLGSSLGGETQTPFAGIDYDFIFWIDSDIIFSPEHFYRMLDSPHDVTSGLYLMQGGVNYAAVPTMDDAFYKRYGQYQFLTKDGLEEFRNRQGRYAPVGYCGMGWMLVRRGVFEKLKYPWFSSAIMRIEGADVVELCSEDVTFCKRLEEELGIKVHVDTSVVVGHLKEAVI